MAINYPGPYTVEFKYIVSSMTHTHTVNCDVTNNPSVGDAFSSILVLQNDTLTTSLDLAVEAYLLTYVVFYNTSVSFPSVRLFKNIPNTFERTFVSAYTPTNGAGTDPSVTQLAHQDMYTFFTAEGGIARFSQLEGVQSGNDQKAFAQLGSAQQTYVNYILGNNGWFVGRDTSRIKAFNLLSEGQNEAVWRKRYRIL